MSFQAIKKNIFISNTPTSLEDLGNWPKPVFGKANDVFVMDPVREVGNRLLMLLRKGLSNAFVELLRLHSEVSLRCMRLRVPMNLNGYPDMTMSPSKPEHRG